MPALPNVPGVLKYVLEFNVEADARAQCVHHFSYTGGPPSGANLVAMANSAIAAANSNYIGIMGDSVSIGGCIITDLTSATSATGVGTTAGSAGTRGTTLLAPGTAVVVAHTIARRYRGGHPRSYFPFGISTDILTTGLWASGFITSVQADFAAWVTAVLASGAGCTVAQLVNVSYYAGFISSQNPVTGRWRNIPRTRVTPVVDTVTGSVARTKIGSQRRRNRDA
jgi:hypothetical protein